MKKKILVVAAIAMLATSCTMSYPGIATGNKIEKTGVAQKKLFLNLAFTPVDLSIVKAASNGGITKVATVDYSIKKSLFFTTYKVMVTGN